VNNKIYIVVEVEYSSYDIIAAFDSKDKAKEFLENTNTDYYDVEIKELDLNPDTSKYRGMKHYLIYMNKKGNITFLSEDDISIFNFNKTYETFFVIENESKDIKLKLMFIARDKEQAIKYANSRWKKIISKNGWGKYNILR